MKFKFSVASQDAMTYPGHKNISVGNDFQVGILSVWTAMLLSTNISGEALRDYSNNQDNSFEGDW